MFVILGVGYRYVYRSWTTSALKYDSLILSFYQEEVPEYVADSIKNRDQVKDIDRGSILGTVNDIKIDKSVSWLGDAEGKYIKSSKEGYTSVNVSFEAKGNITENSIVIDNNEYYIGEKVKLRIGKAIFSGNISSIKRKD